MLTVAHVRGVIKSLIATCELNDNNCFDYLFKLQQNRRMTEIEPERWLPWKYQEALEGATIKQLKSSGD